MYHSIFIALLIFYTPALSGQELFRLQEGRIYFVSDAPLELIQAASTEMKGILDLKTRSFAFSVPMASFEGFNSPLQRVHFNENYMESNRFPEATFSGKIIENYDLSVPGTYSLRAKGKLNIHGVEQERIIKGKATVEKGQIRISSAFTVLLEEHNISIPKIVYQKIAEEIKVDIEVLLKP